MTERRAQDAERELIKLKLLSYLADRIGEELHATITGVEKFGMFCTGIELPAEGLVHISTMGDDHYDYDERLHTLVGRRSNRTYRLGDFVRVVIAKVDLAERKLEMRLVVEDPNATSESRRRETQSRQDREAPRHKSHGPPKRGRRR
jgi:ribonuclease R